MTWRREPTTGQAAGGGAGVAEVEAEAEAG
jgi:hypothetical protein